MRLKNRIAYAKRPGITSQPLLKSRLKTGSTSKKLYQDCRIPLDLFLDCLYDKDYSGLVISGAVCKEDIIQAWEKIYAEYSDIANDGNGNELYGKTVEINYIHGKIFCIDKCVKHLQMSYNSDIHDILKYYGVDANLKSEDTTRERYDKLNIVIAKTKRWAIQLDVLHAEFEVLRENATAGTGGREVFEENLSQLSMYRKYAVLEKDITVRQYVKGLKSMEREYNRLQAQK